MVIDRYLFIIRNLPIVKGDETVLDVGCGSGAFTIAAALRGYRSYGLSWDHDNYEKCFKWSKILGVSNRATFQIFDVRFLSELEPMSLKFDFIINTENIEHIIDDLKLMRDMAFMLKPGGRLLLTTPFFNYLPLSPEDNGPFYPIEDGRHVIRGYSKSNLIELCEKANLRLESISYCSGMASQLTTRLLRFLIRFKTPLLLAHFFIFPLRIFSYVFERFGIIGHGYSICLVAVKDRFKI